MLALPEEAGLLLQLPTEPGLVVFEDPGRPLEEDPGLLVLLLLLLGGGDRERKARMSLQLSANRKL